MGTLLASPLSVPGLDPAVDATRTWSVRSETPLVPLVPSWACVRPHNLMIKLPSSPGRYLSSVVIGLVIYFTYSIKHSKVQAMSPRNHRSQPLLRRTQRHGLQAAEKLISLKGTASARTLGFNLKWL